MENNTNPQFHLETINGEPHLVLTFSDPEWLEENLWISERDVCCAGMLDAIPKDLRIEINYYKFIKALEIVKEYSQTLHEVQIDCDISSQHFDNSTDKTLLNERVQITHPAGDNDFSGEFCIQFYEYYTDFEYELAVSWDMLGLSHCETLEDIRKTLLNQAIAEDVMICE
ncbi:MAG: hypothetical protein IKX14_02670 [Neisseriaceae bacterium]|nr:hypothetical protein [Neisseriaceae bacterium]